MGCDGSRLAWIRARGVVVRELLLILWSITDVSVQKWSIVLARVVYCMSRMPLLVVLDHFTDQYFML